MFLIAFVIGLLTWLVVWDHIHKRHRNALFNKSRITGPPVHPLIGCGLDAIHVGAKNILPYLGECQEKYGKTFCMWMLNEAQIFTSDVRLVETILTSPALLAKGDLYDMFRPWLADGLLMSVGRKWHARRKIFTPAFHFKMLDQYLAVFDEQSTILARRLAKRADGRTEVDVFPEMCLAALDVIAETAMGVKVHAQQNSDCSYVKDLKTVAHIQCNRLLKITQRYDWLFRLTAPFEYRRLTRAIRNMHEFTTQVIEDRRQALVRSMADGSHRAMDDDDADVGSKRRMALLDILLQSEIDGKPLTNEEIREEVDTFVFAGDDTTSSVTSHILYCISRHPEVQRKLINEIEAVFGSDPDSPVTMAQMQELKYMECVVKETMRLYTTVPIIGRKINEDLKLDDGFTIPAKTSVYLMLYYLHRDGNIFPEPEQFRPERFESVAGEVGQKRNPFVYTPFSAGPRNCLGQKFAMLEIKAITSKILRYFELLPLGRPVEPMFNFILRSPHGMIVGLKPRTKVPLTSMSEATI